MIIQFSQLKTLISLQMLQLVLKWSVHFPLSFWLKISKNILFCAIRSGSHKRVSFVYCLSTFATVRKVYSLIFFFFFFSCQCEPTLLPEPNHVMLNHLYALSIKDGVMVLSATHRYRKKYVTTLLYKPI